MTRSKTILGFVLAGAMTLAVTALAQAPAPAPKSGMMMMKSASKKPLLDINSATKTELQALKGVGDKRADDIIKGRLVAKHK